MVTKKLSDISENLPHNALNLANFNQSHIDCEPTHTDDQNYNINVIYNNSDIAHNCKPLLNESETNDTITHNIENVILIEQVYELEESNYSFNEHSENHIQNEN